MFVRIATYNVENLFAEGPEAKKPASRRALRRMLNLLEADVIVLQEVGSLEVLEALNNELDAPFHDVGLIPGNSTRSIHLGVLSRFGVRLVSHRSTILYDGQGLPLQGFASEADALAAQPSELRLQRDVLQVELQLGRAGMGLFGVHLKSKGSPAWADLTSDTIREAEARCVTRIITEYQEENPDRHIALLGDFNDTASSDPMAPIRQLQFIDPHKRWFQSTGRNPTSYWPRRKKRIDRIYLSPATHDLVVPGSQIIHSGEMAKQASDHYPVSIQLEMPDA